MNKILLFSVISIFILASLVVAQNGSSSEPIVKSDDLTKGNDKSINLDKFNQESKNLGRTALDKVTTFSNKEVVLPDWSKKVTNAVFKLEGDFSFNKLITIIILLIILLFVIIEVMEFTPFENKNIQKAMAVCITLIIAVSGSLNDMADTILTAGPILLNWKTILGAILLMSIVKFVKKIKHRFDEKKAQEESIEEMKKAKEEIRNLANMNVATTKKGNVYTRRKWETR